MHQAQEAQSLLPLIALLANADGGTAADHIWLRLHLQSQASNPGRSEPAPFLALLANADGNIVADHIWLHPQPKNRIQKTQCLLPRIAFLAGADGSTAANHIRFRLCPGH